MSIYILLAMIFLHIVDDFKLQMPTLANLKQRVFWQENAPAGKYKHDYIVALILHSFSWSFMIMTPIAFITQFVMTPLFVILFLLNIVIHAIVDDLKANKLKINLIVDQSIHMVQLIVTFLLFAQMT